MGMLNYQSAVTGDLKQSAGAFPILIHGQLPKIHVVLHGRKVVGHILFGRSFDVYGCFHGFVSKKKILHCDIFLLHFV